VFGPPRHDRRGFQRLCQARRGCRFGVAPDEWRVLFDYCNNAISYIYEGFIHGLVIFMKGRYFRFPNGTFHSLMKITPHLTLSLFYLSFSNFHER
jgi:hypothetical protein